MKSLLYFIFFSVSIAAYGQDSIGLSPESRWKYLTQKPEFPGGIEELNKFLTKNIVYPQMERDNDIQGRVLVEFGISDSGKVENPIVLRKVSPGMDKESLRVIRSLPNF